MLVKNREIQRYAFNLRSELHIYTGDLCYSNPTDVKNRCISFFHQSSLRENATMKQVTN